MTAITENDQLTKQPGDHIHPPNEGKIALKIAHNRAKEDAKNQPFKSMKRIFDEAFGNVELENEDVMDNLPSFKRHKTSLYDARRSRIPKIPHSKADISLEGEWTTTVDGREFVIANDREEDRLLIFGTTQNLRHLCAADTIFMDGTFKAAPEMYQQVYSIHVQVMETMVPVCVGLLPAKNTETYVRFFRLIQKAANRYGLNFSPSTISIDFESAMINSIQRIFPGARIRGCLFHFSQALWRRVQEVGLVVRYKNDNSFNGLVRRAAALPLIPTHMVDEVWTEVLGQVDQNDVALMRFCDYVTKTWVDNLTALFPIEIWNQSDNVGGVRTNNHLEGWHSRLNKELGRPHPNVYALIEILKAEQQRVEHRLRLLRFGDVRPQQRPKYRKVTEKLLRLQRRLRAEQITIHEYAGAVGGILKLQ